MLCLLGSEHIFLKFSKKRGWKYLFSKNISAKNILGSEKHNIISSGIVGSGKDRSSVDFFLSRRKKSKVENPVPDRIGPGVTFRPRVFFCWRKKIWHQCTIYPFTFLKDRGHFGFSSLFFFCKKKIGSLFIIVRTPWDGMGTRTTFHMVHMIDMNAPEHRGATQLGVAAHGGSPRLLGAFRSGRAAQPREAEIAKFSKFH